MGISVWYNVVRPPPAAVSMHHYPFLPRRVSVSGPAWRSAPAPIPVMAPAVVQIAVPTVPPIGRVFPPAPSGPVSVPPLLAAIIAPVLSTAAVFPPLSVSATMAVVVVGFPTSVLIFIPGVTLVSAAAVSS